MDRRSSEGRLSGRHGRRLEGGQGTGTCYEAPNLQGLSLWLRHLASVLVLALASLHPAKAAETTTYVLTDTQGTVLAREDAQGTAIATYDYRPYGRQQAGPMTPAPGYTGHVNDPDTGLVYTQARYYDPSIGRFLSVDPDMGAFNRFAYANSNPVSLIDATGRSPDCSQACMKMRARSDKSSSLTGLSGNGFDESSTIVDAKVGRAATAAANAALDASPVKMSTNLDELAQ